MYNVGTISICKITFVDIVVLLFLYSLIIIIIIKKYVGTSGTTYNSIDLCLISTCCSHNVLNTPE